MTFYVDIKEGDFALLLEGHLCTEDAPVARNVSELLRMFQYFDFVPSHDRMFFVVPVGKVRKVTFLTPTRRQFRRNQVVGMAPTREEAVNLGREIHRIGSNARYDFEAGIRDVSIKVRGEVERAAQNELIALMPRLFERAAA